MRMDFVDVLRATTETEATPPVYYVLGWGWTRIFGDGEVGLRSLSALAGTLTIPAAYAAGMAFCGRRAAVVAAAVVAVAPALCGTRRKPAHTQSPCSSAPCRSRR